MTSIEKRDGKNDEITSFTLAELLSMASANTEKRIHECVIAHDSSHLEAFRFPCRIDAFIIGICTEGSAVLSFNMQEYRLQKNDLFLYIPKNIVQVHSSENFRSHVIAITSDFIQRLSIDTTRMMPLYLQFAAHPSLPLNDQECRTLRSFFSLIDQQTRMPDAPFIAEILGGLVTALLYKVGCTLQNYLEQHPQEQTATQSRAETYFRQFMILLGEHFKTERSVGFYARKLYITPKYLTTLIRRISGKSVSEWIDSYVILEAKTLLKYSDMSIQEIAYALNFPNQSFFGSYFKRNTGISPTRYKLDPQTGSSKEPAARGGYALPAAADRRRPSGENRCDGSFAEVLTGRPPRIPGRTEGGRERLLRPGRPAPKAALRIGRIRRPPQSAANGPFPRQIPARNERQRKKRCPQSAAGGYGKPGRRSAQRSNEAKTGRGCEEREPHCGCIRTDSRRRNSAPYSSNGNCGSTARPPGCWDYAAGCPSPGAARRT